MPDPVSDAAAFDPLYQMLVEAHRDLSPDASRRLDARLVLLLAERLGDRVRTVQADMRAFDLAPDRFARGELVSESSVV